MRRVTQNPLPAVIKMLETCRRDEVSIFLTDNGRVKSICVYPVSNDAIAADLAVQIAGRHDPVVHAAVVGLVHVHNLRLADLKEDAVGKFIRASIADFYFGSGPAEGR
jgi:hypothetical protein